MSGTSLDSSPWRFCEAASSSLRQADPQDWLSSFDFSHLASSSSKQGADDLASLFDLDISELDLPLPDENLPSLHLSDALFLPDVGCGVQESTGYFPVFELNGSDGSGGMQENDGFSSAAFELHGSHVHGRLRENKEFSSSFEANESTHDQTSSKFIMMEKATDVHSLPLKSQSSIVSSPHESDAGSSLAARECVFSRTENHADHVKDPSHRKRHHEDSGSDLDGGEKDGRSRADPLDKRQQRLLRNRQLALESRQRKKSYISDLEMKCKMLEQERNQLQQQLGFASAENAVLRKELCRVKKMKDKDGVAEPAVLFRDSLPLEFLLLLICLLLTAQLSLCVSRSLAWVLRTSVFPQITAKVGGSVEKQVFSTRCFILIISHMKRLGDHLWYHMQLVACGLFRWQVPFLHMEQSCNLLRVSRSHLLHC